MTFRDLGLKEDVLNAIEQMGFETPTAIQEAAIPRMLATTNDFVGLAQTGTGKTAAYGLPMVNKVSFSEPNVQGLVICPTRELCLQVANDLKSFSKSYKKAKVVPVYGGVDINKQIKDIQKGAQIIVATPGRLVDLIKRKKVNLTDIDIAVLDEADEMLNMGFKEDIDFILGQTSNEKSVWLFSATMPREVERIAKRYMKDPENIVVGKQNSGNDNIEHCYFQVNERDRYNAMKRYIDLHPEIFGLVFCRTRRDTQKIADSLIKDGYNAAAIHGDLSQSQRDHVMQQFRDRNVQMLVATDVAARGIDVNEITHVIHHMLPDEIENYTHRSGRTGRAGNKGVSLAILNTRENRKIKDIERKSGVSFTKIEVPKPEDVCGAQLEHLMLKIANVEVKEKEIAPYLSKVLMQFEDMSKEEILTRWVTVEMEQLLDYYKKAGKDLNASASKGKDRGDRDRGGSRRDSGRSRRRDSRDDGDKDTIFISLGSKDGLNPGGVVRALCDQSGIDSSAIGRIDIKNNFAFVDVDSGMGKAIEQKIDQFEFEGKTGSVEMKNGGSKSGGGSRSGGGNRGGGGGRRSGGYGKSSGSKGGSGYRGGGGRKRSR